MPRNLIALDRPKPAGRRVLGLAAATVAAVGLAGEHRSIGAAAA
jgi:hypothetical protein